MEAAYEDTEDVAIEHQFAVANATMARLQLSCQNYDEALEYYESVIGLLPEDGTSQTQVLRAQCQFGSGLAHFKAGRLEETIESFEAALSSTESDLRLRGHVVVLLAQSLWAVGTEESKENAKEQLLDWYESNRG